MALVIRKRKGKQIVQLFEQHQWQLNPDPYLSRLAEHKSALLHKDYPKAVQSCASR
jgi:hypothetical protein